MAKARTGVAFEQIVGCVDGGVAYGRNGGTMLRSRPTYRYRVTPPVAQGNDRLKQANAVWSGVGEITADAWDAYGRAHPRVDPVSGHRYASAGKNVFVGLSCKLLQLDATASLPHLPPMRPFIADDVVVELGVSIGEDERRVSVVEGAILFEASGPNSPGVVTELLIQPLKSVRSKPQTFYKSHGFVAFEEGNLGAEVALPAGVYACATQFVERSSGRTVGWARLGKVTVE